MANSERSAAQNHVRSAGRRQGRGKRYVLLALLLATSALATLVVVEMVLRRAGFSYELRATVVEGTVIDAERIKGTYLVDRDLIWVPKGHYATLAAAVAANPAILFMGDSCTQMGRYDRYFASIVAEACPGRVLRSANLGIAGWSSHQGLQQMRRDVVRIKPRAVTIYYGWNDHWNSVGMPDAEVTRLNASPLFGFQSVRLVQLLTKAYVGVRRMRQDRPPLRVPPRDFRQNLTAMVDMARNIGAVPVLLTAPTSHQRGREPRYLAQRWITDINELVPLHRKYVELVRQVAEDKGVILCDLAAEFDVLLSRSSGSALFFGDGIHLTEKGNRLVAHFLFDCFKRNNLLEDILK